MNKLILISSIILIIGLGVGLSINVSGEEALIPSWIKTTAGFWVDGKIVDQEFIQALQYLVEKDILKIPEKEKSVIDQIHGNVIFPKSNAEIIKQLNENKNTFTGLSCKDYQAYDGTRVKSTGKFTSGDFNIDYMNIIIAIIDHEGVVINTEIVDFYDINPNESRYFEQDIHSDGIGWEKCELQVRYVRQP